MERKICIKCKIEKDLSFFSFRKDTQKYRSQCQDCIKLINKEYQIRNKEQIDIQRKEYRDKTKNLKRLYDIEYRERNREKIQLYKKNYFQNNKEEVYNKIKKRKDEDINFRLAHNLRKRVGNAFKAQNLMKRNKTMELLDCSHSFFKNWISFQLYGNMTMENYGKVWNLDHCLAVSTFNLLDENEMRKCFNWLNLRPMYVKENISRG